MRAFLDKELGADNQLEAQVAGGFVGPDHAGHGTFVGQGKGAIAQGRGTLDQLGRHGRRATKAERAQGMQFLPAAVIREHPMWFVFETPQVQSWHMRNVQLALDILYVDANGLIIGREMMEPQGSGYGIGQPIAAALELAAGQAEQYGLRAGVRLQLQE